MTTAHDLREPGQSEPAVEADTMTQPRTAVASGTLTLLAPVLDAHNRRGIRVGIAYAIASMALLGVVPLIQQVILDDAILAGSRSLSVWITLLVLVGVGSFGT